jgi:hypothetical protein
MKKFLIVSLLALVLITPAFASAQTVTQEEVNAQLLQIINSLMVQVQALMAKLVAMQTQQVTDSKILQTVVQQTTPVVPVLGNVQTPEVPKVVKRDRNQECQDKYQPSAHTSGGSSAFLEIIRRAKVLDSGGDLPPFTCSMMDSHSTNKQISECNEWMVDNADFAYCTTQ